MAEVELQQFGLYTTTELLRVSSTSTFFRARLRKKDLLIKKLNIPLSSLEAKEAFLARAKQFKKLKNRNIVNVLDANFVGDYAYLVMDYIEGETLRQRIPPGVLIAPDEVKAYLSPLASAIHYAHISKMLHNNLHPGNLLTAEHNTILLTEFSLALPGIDLLLDDQDFAVPYMAPEHLQGQPTAASDQYSLAVMAYEWLCGRRPYEATERELLLEQQKQATFPAPRSLNEAISPAVERVILQALSYDPTERFSQAQEFADQYLGALMGFPVKINIAPPPVVPPPLARPIVPPLTRPVVPATPVLGIADALAKDDASHPDSALPQLQEAAPPGPSTPEATILSMPLNGKAHVQKLHETIGSTPDWPDEESVAEKVIPILKRISFPSANNGNLQANIAHDLYQGGILSQSLPGYEERTAQVEMATLVARALTENVPAIIEAGTGTGKALDVETPIPTPDGWKPMGDLATGDFVFDEQGHATRVTAAFDVMYDRPCYEVVFSDGSSLIADAEHEWASYTHADRKHVGLTQTATYKARNFITSDQLAPLSRTPLTTVLDRPTRDLSKPQNDKQKTYTLVTTEQMAATLTVSSQMGNGVGASPCVRPAGRSKWEPGRTQGDAPTPFREGFLPKGRRANHAIKLAAPLTLPDANLPVAPYLLGCQLGDDSSDKSQHIPTIYLRASEQQRRALLAGLLDTDGTVSHTGAIEFTTTTDRLAQNVYELVCSLGLRPTLRCGRAQYKGKDCGPKWTIAFTTQEQVFRLARKVTTHRERLRNYSSERNRYRYVVAVHEVPSRPVRCIQVASQSHLYLAGKSMIPTHNSLAYLVPIVRSGKVAIVSTANKALQEQLFYKDIPFVQQHIKHFEAALVKGVSNYVCIDRVETERTGMQFYAKNRDFQRLLEVVNDPESTFSGDFETLGFQLPGDIRSRVATDSDQCAWSKCSFFNECYVRQMREDAENAQVIVVNHTLLLLDAAMGGFLLPERDVIVLDEAHHLEEEATRSFTVTITPTQVQTLLAQRMLKDHTLLRLQDETMKAAENMWSRLLQVANPGYKGRVNLDAPLEEGLRLATVILDLADSLRKQRPKDMPEKEGQLYDKLLKRAQNLSENVRTVFSVAQPDKFVYYVERIETSSARVTLQASAAPLDVTSWLRERLFDKCNVICTSATLATLGPTVKGEAKGPNFAYFRRRIGLDTPEYADILERVLPLTFDYESNALLYLPRDLPEPAYGPGAEDYMKSIAREMYKLVKLSHGRAFLLFSSKRMLDRAYELMEPHLDYPLLKQGDMTRIELTRRFRAEEGSVLFGLKSFWEGVDIAGDALSLVVIDKLPFDPPDDPVHEARVAQMKAKGENWFGIYVLPQAVLRLKQGIGRLLRSRDDRGVMAILDTRLYTKGYGKLVLDALPPAQRTSSLRDVERFFS